MIKLTTKTMKASFDTTTLEGQMKVFNAQNGASHSLKNLPEGTVINVSGVLIYEDKVDSYGGEQDSKITVLYDKNGESYAGVSATVAQAADKLIAFIENTGVESVKVKVVKATSQGGRDFLNLQMVFDEPAKK